jgi:hypothetical protein
VEPLTGAAGGAVAVLVFRSGVNDLTLEWEERFQAGRNAAVVFGYDPAEGRFLYGRRLP